MTTEEGNVFAKLPHVEWDQIVQIAQRANAMEASLFPDRDPLPGVTIVMAIACVHVGPHPLRLGELLAADPANFAHDVFGIMEHFNIVNRKLEDGFIPRFAQLQGASHG